MLKTQMNSCFCAIEWLLGSIGKCVFWKFSSELLVLFCLVRPYCAYSNSIYIVKKELGDFKNLKIIYWRMCATGKLREKPREEFGEAALHNSDLPVLDELTRLGHLAYTAVTTSRVLQR